MAEPVNLNRFRKEKARTAKKARADANTVKFGRSKSETTLSKARSVKEHRDLDQKKRDT